MIKEIDLKKGAIAEEIVKEYLRSKGYITYSPDNKDTAHCFDLVFSHGKNAVFFGDVKIKTTCITLRGKQGLFTGIPIKQYEQYLNFVSKTGCKFYLIFVDLKDSMVYQGELMQLNNPEYIAKGQTIVWNRNQMKLLFELNFEQIERLKNLAQSEVPHQ